MTTKAVILAQKSGEGTDMILPHTSADLVGYEKENSTATNVREALDEINDNAGWVVRTVDNGTPTDIIETIYLVVE